MDASKGFDKQRIPLDAWPDLDHVMKRDQGESNESDDIQRQRRLFESWLEFIEFKTTMKDRAASEAPKRRENRVQLGVEVEENGQDEDEEGPEDGFCTATKWTTRTTLMFMFGVIMMATLGVAVLFLEGMDEAKYDFISATFKAMLTNLIYLKCDGHEHSSRHSPADTRNQGDPERYY